MRRRTTLLLACLLLCGFSSGQVQDIAWQAQFAGAVNWSTLGVVADGTTDNTAALNALPLNTPIIGDCPAGSTIQVAGVWYWQAGLTVWQQPGCQIVSQVTTVGDYAIDDPNFSNSIPNDNIQYYGLNFTMATPTSTVRVLRLWSDHFKLKYFTIAASGGLFFLRGSDQEVGFGTGFALSSTGNPGIRHIGNIPKVATSPGMHANVWFHNLYLSVGDAAFQACQPLGTSLWTNVSSDDVLYENTYGISASSSVMLINEPNATAFSNYSCNNIRFSNVSGIGIWTALVSGGGDNSSTSNVSITGGATDNSASTSTGASVLVGDYTIGGGTSTGITNSVTLNGVSVANAYKQDAVVSGNVTGFQLLNSNMGVPRTLTAPVVEVQGTTSSTLSGNTIATDTGADAVALGSTSLQTISPIVSSNTITGVGNNRAGIRLLFVNQANVSANTTSPRASTTTAVGIALTAAGSNAGTTNAVVKANNVSAMTNNPRIICASGQGNSVTGNTGASDCSP
jgi:hypothetical protein